jgi:hypothetical protein
MHPGLSAACSLALTLALCAPRAAAQQDTPLSAIDWLSQSVETPPQEASAPSPPPPPDEPAVATDIPRSGIAVTTLDRPSPDGVGLLPPEVTGLPPTLWAGSDSATLVTLLRAGHGETLPAVRDLLVTLLLARADPPLPPDGSLFLARIDRLLDIGALEPAQALLEATDRSAPEVFRRWFDVSLLTGTEDAACAMIRTRPALASTYPARIFCLARNGDWQAAALTLSSARALDEITSEDEALLARFLDPELFEGAAPLPPPSRPSPLVFRLREAVGEALPTATLPRAFAHADLRPTAAWRNRIEAAERLARAGAIPGGVLLAAYTERTPAASGGVWDRARAIQAFDRAITAGDAAGVAATLAPAWQAMQVIRAEVAFASLYAGPLAALDLPPAAAALAFRIALLSPDYESAAIAHTPAGPEDSLLVAIARGSVADLPPGEALAGAIIAGFSGAAVSQPVAGLIRDGRIGEAILRTLVTADQGLAGDPAALTEAIAALRLLGLEGTARSMALQALILGRPA